MKPIITLAFRRHTRTFMLLDPARAQWSHGPEASPDALTRVAVLQQGCIDNHLTLRKQLEDRGYEFSTTTDGELIAHLIDAIHPGDGLQAVRRASALLQGSLGFAVQFRDSPARLLATCSGTPLALQYDGSSIQWTNTAKPESAAHVYPSHQTNATVFHLYPGEILELQLTDSRVPFAADHASPVLTCGDFQTSRIKSGYVFFDSIRHNAHGNALCPGQANNNRSIAPPCPNG